jgi:hypothetical protein
LDFAAASSKANFGPFNLPEPSIPDTVSISPDYIGGDSKGAYDFSEIQQYSDLEYLQLETTLGIRYKLRPSWLMYWSVTWMKTEDDQPYVYSDQTGSVWWFSLGMTAVF